MLLPVFFFMGNTILFISNSHFSYLLSTVHVMDVTIDYLTCTEYVKLCPQQFFGIRAFFKRGSVGPGQ